MRSLSRHAIALATIALPAAAEAKEYGVCRFNWETLRYAGTVEQTAAGLLRKVNRHGSGSVAQPVPQWLTERLMQPMPFTTAQIEAYLRRERIDPASLTARLRIGDTPSVRYFVIHDTSTPKIPPPSQVFPDDIDRASYSGNSLQGWRGLQPKVNLLINRVGESRVLNSWGTVRPETATKLEDAVAAARPIFVHVENIQPRVTPPGASWAWVAPEQGFSAAQERRLALAYIIASMHAGRWLIPAYHFNVDQGVGRAHDDPQNVSLASWVAHLIALDQAIQAEPRG